MNLMKMPLQNVKNKKNNQDLKRKYPSATHTKLGAKRATQNHKISNKLCVPINFLNLTMMTATIYACTSLHVLRGSVPTRREDFASFWFHAVIVSSSGLHLGVGTVQMQFTWLSDLFCVPLPPNPGTNRNPMATFIAPNKPQDRGIARREKTKSGTRQLHF